LSYARSSFVEKRQNQQIQGEEFPGITHLNQSDFGKIKVNYFIVLADVFWVPAAKVQVLFKVNQSTRNWEALSKMDQMKYLCGSS
jgi:hypothetical protein